MTLDLTQLEDGLRNILGVPVTHPKFSTTNLDLYLNRSFWEILDKVEFREKEASGTFPTVASERYYDLPVSFDYLQHLSIVDLVGQHTQLIKMTPEEYESSYSEDSANETFPTHYIREGCGIKLWPTPDQVYTIVIKFTINLADLSVTNTNPGVPQVWHEVILFGAAWRAFLELGDFPRYQQYIALHTAKMAEIKPVEYKEEEDNRFAGVQAMRPSYP